MSYYQKQRKARQAQAKAIEVQRIYNSIAYTIGIIALIATLYAMAWAIL